MLLCVIIYIGISYWKTPVIFKYPRFWAEEGAEYYRNCFGDSLSVCMSYTHSGSYQLFTNIIVYLSTKVSVLNAPFVTTYLSYALQLIVVVQISLFAKAYQVSRINTIFLVAAWALLPQTFEVWMTSTNVQWVAGVSVLLIIMMPYHWIEQNWKGIGAWYALCGLSGVPAAIVAPVVFLRAIVNRSRRMLVVATILGSCATFQAIILMTSGTSALRTYPKDPITLGMPLFFQTVLSPIFSIDFASTLGQGGGTTLLGVFLLGSGVIAIVVSVAWIAIRNQIVLICLFAWMFVTLIQTFGGLGPEKFMSGIAGSRYFLFGSMCLCIMLAWGTKAQITSLKVIAICLLAFITISGVVNTLNPAMRFLFDGPSWSTQIRACPEAKPCHVSIWPGGPWALSVIRSPQISGGKTIEIIK
jgi:hypothetical protein